MCPNYSTYSNKIHFDDVSLRATPKTTRHAAMRSLDKKECLTWDTACTTVSGGNFRTNGTQAHLVSLAPKY